MDLVSPVPVYNAATNVEAQMVRTFLNNAGIDAYTVEDNSYVGTFSLGIRGYAAIAIIAVGIASLLMSRTNVTIYESQRLNREAARAELLASSGLDDGGEHAPPQTS